MVNNYIAPVSNNTKSSANTSQASTYNNSQIQSMLMAGNLEPKFASMLIAQMSNNSVNDILFGSSSDDNTDSNSSTNDFLGLSTSDISGNYSTAGSNSSTNPLFSSLGLNSVSSISPQYEMSIYSNLIGKTVTAIGQSTGKEITGKVISVQYQNGVVTLDIGGVIAAASSIKTIKGE